MGGSSVCEPARATVLPFWMGVPGVGEPPLIESSMGKAGVAGSASSIVPLLVPLASAVAICTPSSAGGLSSSSTSSVGR